MDVFPSTPTIQKAVSLIEKVPARLIVETSKLTGLGKYESDKTAENFLKLIIRNVDAVLLLCRHDLLLLPPALNISRPILETGGNALWLMSSKEPCRRESRLVALLSQEDKEREKYLNNLTKFSIDISEKKKIEDDRVKLQAYRDQVKAKIPKGSYEDIQKPSFNQLLEDPLLNLGHLYLSYRVLCGSTHGSHAITWIYKRELNKGFGECIDPRDWYTPLYICWWILAQVGAQFLETFGGDRELFLPKSLREEITLAVNKINILPVGNP